MIVEKDMRTTTQSDKNKLDRDGASFLIDIIIIVVVVVGFLALGVSTEYVDYKESMLGKINKIDDKITVNNIIFFIL